MYPKFKNKHLEKPLFNPNSKENVKNRDYPNKYIIIYDKRSKAYLLRKYRPKKIETTHSQLYEMYKYKNIGFIKINGIGSPQAVFVLEKLIHRFKGKHFINLGFAGGLETKGIVLCTKALRDEGTSYHYDKHQDYSYPDKGLTNRLENSLKRQGIDFIKGANWTIDAFYKETKAEISRFKKRGICTVDMEASALFTVAKCRKVKIASAFIVSDILGKRHKLVLYEKNTIIKLNQLLDAAIECLINIKC